MGRTDALRASFPRIFPVLLIVCIARTICAQTSPAEDSVPRIYLATIEPGDAPWERFGHDAIVITGLGGQDVAVNYGMFDFDAPNFIGNFVLGRMKYWMEGDDWPATRQMYIGANRSVWMQELNLTPAQRARLIQALRENARPENKYYRYDYFRDNCTTRVRDALDKSVDGEIYKQLKDVPTGTTFRSHTRIGMAEYFWLYTGLELAMGPSTDRKLSAWEECFLPARLMDHLNSVTIDDGAGNRVPLIKNSTQLYKSTRSPLPDRPPSWWWGFLLVGIALGGSMMLLARKSSLPLPGTPGRGQGRGVNRRDVDNRARSRSSASNPSPQPSPRSTGEREFRRAPRVLFILLAIFWASVCSLASLFMLFIWFCTDHAAGYRNESLFQFSPISFVVLAAAMWGFRWKIARPAVLLVLGISILNILLKPLPWFYEWNWEMIALALPVHAGLAIAVLMLQNKSSKEQST